MLPKALQTSCRDPAACLLAASRMVLDPRFWSLFCLGFGLKCPPGQAWSIPPRGAEHQAVCVSLCQLSAMLSPAECKACYHKSCFKSTRCPRCERLQARRELLAKQSMESYVSDYEDELEQPEAVAAT